RARVVHGRTVSVPVYVHAPVAQPGEQGYSSLDAVSRASEEAAVVLRDELARVTGAAKRALAVASKVGPAGLDHALSRLVAQAEAAAALIAAPDAAAAGCLGRAWQASAPDRPGRGRAVEGSR